MATEHVLDVRGLEPPEPLERAIDALEAMQAGERLRMIISREPFPLYGILDRDGWRHSATAYPDGHYEILIWR